MVFIISLCEASLQCSVACTSVVGSRKSVKSLIFLDVHSLDNIHIPWMLGFWRLDYLGIFSLLCISALWMITAATRRKRWCLSTTASLFLAVAGQKTVQSFHRCMMAHLVKQHWYKNRQGTQTNGFPAYMGDLEVKWVALTAMEPVCLCSLSTLTSVFYISMRCKFIHMWQLCTRMSFNQAQQGIMKQWLCQALDKHCNFFLNASVIIHKTKNKTRNIDNFFFINLTSVVYST